MAVWADFDDDEDPASSPDLIHAITAEHGHDDVEQQQNPSVYVSYALRCYPVAEKLASYLDLTDLDSLSSTCRSVHDSLVQFACQLKQKSLRCTFDISEHDQGQRDAALALQLSLQDQLTFDSSGPAFPVHIYHEQPPSQASSHGSAKVSKCARDLVAPCRKCGITVCRNCIEKPPSNRLLPGRLRRLCDTCLEKPLALHTGPSQELVEHLNSSASSTRSHRSNSDGSDHSADEHHNTRTKEYLSAASATWRRDPCTCTTRGVYVCHQCAHSNIAADRIYQNVWKWRSRYSTHLGGGLGTGLGLGDQGQKCGRDKYCLAKRDATALMEAECSSEDVSTPLELSRSNTPLSHDEARPEPGYFRQEIEGVGGKVKSKSKKLVKVGATVCEFPDERVSGKFLGREAAGELRAWCSWCSRVCPGKRD
ncbi:hypothetical protein LTS08_001330 [Lithohypha guttulata]|nr:hypothetical protein LTS08_001330 [Lithohypha guttulata]